MAASKRKAFRPPWMLLVLVALVGIINTARAETFTAVTHFRSLLNLEQDLSDKLQAYIAAEEKQLEKLKQLSSEVQAWSARASGDYEAHLGHPTNAFRLVRRFTSDWREVEDLVSRPNTEQEELYDRLVTGADFFPDEEDLSGAMTALMRLQDVYHVNTTQFASGMAGSSPGASLSVEDLYLVGRSAYNERKYANCKKWMQEAIRRLDSGHEGADANSSLRLSLYDHLAFAEFKLGNIRRAYRLTKMYLKLDPGSSRHLANQEYYYEKLREEIQEDLEEQQNAEQIAEEKKRLKAERTQNMNDEDYQYWQDFSLYKRLCRAPMNVPPAPDHQLICFYNNMNRNPNLILNPVKTEVVTVNPTLLIYRDVLRDSEIEKLQELASPKLYRATAHNRATGRYEAATYRISKSAWLHERLDPTGALATVNQRIDDITGLSMSTAEELQVVNYGIGGHYEPHFDYARHHEKSAMQRQQGNRIATLLFYSSQVDMGEAGNRIATLLFYLSDVSEGGCTVFPRIPARVVPSKGDASFWYNLLPSGKGDEMTRHAGCPVLSGSKWVCNKWIHEHDQELRKPCKLTEDATWDIHTPPEYL